MIIKGKCIRNASEYLTKGKIYIIKLIKKSPHGRDADLYHIKWDTNISDPTIHGSTIKEYFICLPIDLNKNTRTL